MLATSGKEGACSRRHHLSDPTNFHYDAYEANTEDLARAGNIFAGNIDESLLARPTTSGYLSINRERL